MSEDVFEKYELVGRISTGGMGEILLARQKGVAGSRRNVIIKMILPHLAQDPEFVGRFTDETRIAASLSHGNIVQIFESGSWQGRFYMVMEHVDGLDLKELLKRMSSRRRFDNDEWVAFCVFVLTETARALAYAHEKRGPDGQPLCIVHRDVSPSNILLSCEGLVKLTDFGVAKAARRTAVTMPGKLHGKVNYMAPEQVRGMECDHRSDIFSLGITGYEMLTGKRPFDADSDVAVLEKIRSMTFEPLEQADPKIPPELASIISRAMAADPDSRWQSAEEMVGALNEFAHRKSIVMNSRGLAAMLKPIFAAEPDARENDAKSPDTILENAVEELLRTPSGGVFSEESANTRNQAERTLTISEQIDAPKNLENAGGSRQKIILTIGSILLILAGLAGYRLIAHYDNGPDKKLNGAGAQTTLQPEQDGAKSPAIDKPEPRTADKKAPSDKPVARDSDSTQRPDRQETKAPVQTKEHAAIEKDNPPAVEPRQQATPQHSFATVLSNPSGADIFVDGKRIGRTPEKIQTDSDKVVTLKAEGYADTNHKISAGTGSNVRIELKRPDGSLVFRFFPADATVKIDNRPISSKGNLVRMKLPAGQHTLSVTANKGTPTIDKSFTIEPGKTVALGTIELDLANSDAPEQP